MTPAEQLAALIAEARTVDPTAPRSKPAPPPEPVDWEALDALGEPDYEDGWLIFGRRAIWSPRRCA